MQGTTALPTLSPVADQVQPTCDWLVTANLGRRHNPIPPFASCTSTPVGHRCRSRTICNGQHRKAAPRQGTGLGALMDGRTTPQQLASSPLALRHSALATWNCFTTAQATSCPDDLSRGASDLHRSLSGLTRPTDIVSEMTTRPDAGNDPLRHCSTNDWRIVAEKRQSLCGLCRDNAQGKRY